MDNEKKLFRTLRGFLSGKEKPAENYFKYSATLRIAGENLDFNEINRVLNLLPTYIHRKGGKPGPRSPQFKADMWAYKSSISEERPLEEHIDSLWSDIKHAKEYLLSIKSKANVHVFVGYRSNNDMAGIEIPYTSLEMFIELKIPFGISINIA